MVLHYEADITGIKDVMIHDIMLADADDVLVISGDNCMESALGDHCMGKWRQIYLGVEGDENKKEINSLDEFEKLISGKQIINVTVTCDFIEPQGTLKLTDITINHNYNIPVEDSMTFYIF